jgi:hypothetical protein
MMSTLAVTAGFASHRRHSCPVFEEYWTEPGIAESRLSCTFQSEHLAETSENFSGWLKVIFDVQQKLDHALR